MCVRVYCLSCVLQDVTGATVKLRDAVVGHGVTVTRSLSGLVEAVVMVAVVE